MIQDRAILTKTSERIRGVFCDDALYKLTLTFTFTKTDQQQVAHGLSNGTISNGLERPLTYISRSRHSIIWRWISQKRTRYRQPQWNTHRDLYTPYLFRMTLSNLEWLSTIFNDSKHHSVSLRQLRFLLTLRTGQRYQQKAFNTARYFQLSDSVTAPRFRKWFALSSASTASTSKSLVFSAGDVGCSVDGLADWSSTPNGLTSSFTGACLNCGINVPYGLLFSRSALSTIRTLGTGGAAHDWRSPAQ